MMSPRTTSRADFYDIIDNRINGITITKTGTTPSAYDILVLMKLGLKESVAIKYPLDFGKVYDSKYGHNPHPLPRLSD